jgi:hypothetical protein
MGQLQVLFEVPRFIEHGLSTGTFQRVGGVIVDSSSRQIVAWLRDGSLLETGFKAVTNAVNPLNLVLQAGQAATSLIDGHIVRVKISSPI